MNECSRGIVDKFLEIEGRYKLIQFLMKLNDDYESVRNQILSMDPLPTVNKAYYIVQQVEKQKLVTRHFAEQTAFFANAPNHKFNTNGTKDSKVGRVETTDDGKRSCTYCKQTGHLYEQCFERIGYPDWYKGKKTKKNPRLAANVTGSFEQNMGVTPFDLEVENEVNLNSGSGHGLDQRLVAAVCQESMKMFKGKPPFPSDGASTFASHAGPFN